MASWKAIALVSLFPLMALAGCVGSESGDAGPQAGPSVQFDDDTGAVQGLVQDDEGLPIEGAQVGLQEGAVTSTDARGAFALGNLEPGRYTVFAGALGYGPAAKVVDVNPGQVTEVGFTLTKLASDNPFEYTEIVALTMDAIMWKLTPSCVYTDVHPLVKTCGGVRTSCDPSSACEKHYGDLTGPDSELKTLIVEMDWEPQTGVSGRGFLLDLNVPNVTRGTGGSINQASPYTFQRASDKAPIVHRVDIPKSLEDRGIPESDWYSYPDDDCTAPDEDDVGNCDWFYRTFAAACDLGICPDGLGPDYGVMQDGRATIYVNIFFKEPAPPGFTAVPDG